MIIIFHLTCLSLHLIYECFHKKYLQIDTKTTEQNVTENRVIYAPAQIDPEIGLKFDPPVYLQRYCAVKDILLSKKWRGKIKKAVDFGCAELGMFIYLKNLIGLQEVLFVDVNRDIMEHNADRVNPFTADYLHRRKEPLNIKVLQGSIANPDTSLLFVDAVICIEIIEHLYPETLDAFPHNVFGFIQPNIAIFTTPNADFNVLFPNFPGVRNDDHKFEWTREQFQDWSRNIIKRYEQYSVYFDDIGPGPTGTDNLGFCSQMAVFIKKENYACDPSRQKLIKSLVEKLSSIPNKETCDLDKCLFCEVNISDFTSHGVCTYGSYNTYERNASKCEHFNKLYKMISEVEYPYDIDNRTQEEIIRDKVEYRIHRIGSYRNPCEDNDTVEISLQDLISDKDGHFITIADLRNVLENAGWKIEDREEQGIIIPYVIYTQLSDMSECSKGSESSDGGHFSIDVNSESENDWHTDSKLDNLATWESNFESTLNTTTKTDGTEIWEEATSNDISTPNTKSEISEAGQFRTCLEEASNDRSVNGDQACSPEDKLELIYDSGLQMSTSSINISADSSAEYVPDDKSSLIFKPSTTKIKNDAMKSDSHIFNIRKRKCKLNEALPNRIIPEIILPQEPENPPVVENGDLANNNRDREGNNYQAAQNVEQIYDNAIPREENLDEHNENHIVLEDEQVEINEDEDALESLEDASREVLYDPNSDVALSDSALFTSSDNYSLDRHSLPILTRDAETQEGFPAWLLELYQEDVQVAAAEDFDDDVGILGQGDGLGVHGSDLELIDALDRTSSNSSTTSQENGIAQDLSQPGSSVSVSAVSSSTDMQFHDALESLDESTSLHTDSNVETARTDTPSNNSDAQ